MINFFSLIQNAYTLTALHKETIRIFYNLDYLLPKEWKIISENVVIVFSDEC